MLSLMSPFSARIFAGRHCNSAQTLRRIPAPVIVSFFAFCSKGCFYRLPQSRTAITKR